MSRQWAVWFQKTVETGEQVIVGVNRFVEKEEKPIPLLEIDREVEKRQREKIGPLRPRRDPKAHRDALSRLLTSSRVETNLMPDVLAAGWAFATAGEICDTLKVAWGAYYETPSV